MLKPLILLVDDDTAVLEALRAALASELEEICRVETFADPERVLAAVAEWAEENRPIAVAIVDQKMPGLSGVDLVRRLRSDADGPTHPARHMQVLVLTGYAGLESALTAKNDGGIARYLEKPWQPRALLSEVRSAFRRYLAESQAGRWFTFREVVTEPDVRDHLRMRYEVYRSTAGRAFLPPDGSGLDLDTYDGVSHLLTIFEHAEGAHTPIGTLRVTREVAGPAAGVLEAIAAESPVLAERLHAPRFERLPLLNYWPDRDAVSRILEDADAAGESVAEPGRLTLDGRFRSGWRGGDAAVLIARFMIESSTAFFFFFFFFFRHCLLTCIPAHRRFYRPLGFRDAEGTGRRFVPELDCDNVCLHGRESEVPSPVRERVQSMAVRVGKTGATCLCPTFPACLPGPYENGVFGPTDLFCPLRAAELSGGGPPDEEAGSGPRR